MDFSQESYVRVYTRDTSSWLRLGWQGQSMLMLLLRKLDRNGCIEGVECPDDLARVTGLPAEIVAVALPRLLEEGILTLEDGVLCMPRYVEAQTCKRADRIRQAQHRERRRLEQPPEARVYVLRGANGLLKVGFSTNVLRRVRELKWQLGQDVELLASWPGTMADEGQAHVSFRHLHVKGEWFQDDGSIMAWAQAQVEPGVTAGSHGATGVTLYSALPSNALQCKTEDARARPAAAPHLSKSTPEQNAAPPPQPKPQPSPPLTDADCSRQDAPGSTDEGLYVPREPVRSLDGWEEPPGWDLELAAAGVTRSVFESRMAELRTGPIGGRRGVLPGKVTDYVRNQLPKWRTWGETATAQGKPRVKAELQGGGTWHPSSKIRSYGTKLLKLSGPEVERACQVYARSEDWYGRTRADADKRCAERLRQAAESMGLVEKLGLKQPRGP